jgi:hypothetical protein
MWTAFLGFFGKAFANKWVQRALLVAAVAGLIYLGYNAWKSDIEEGQMLRDQNAQLQRVIKDNNILKFKLEKLDEANKDILIKLEQKNDRVIEKHDTVTKYIQSPDAQKSNRPTSDVIKNTIGMLQNDE